MVKCRKWGDPRSCTYVDEAEWHMLEQAAAFALGHPGADIAPPRHNIYRQDILRAAKTCATIANPFFARTKSRRPLARSEVCASVPVLSNCHCPMLRVAWRA